MLNSKKFIKLRLIALYNNKKTLEETIDDLLNDISYGLRFNYLSFIIGISSGIIISFLFLYFFQMMYQNH